MDASQKLASNANDALALLITKVTSGIDQASDFFAAQIPDVIHQLIVYNLVASLLMCLFSLAVIVLTPIVFRKVYKKYLADSDSNAAWEFVLFLLGVFLEIVFVLVFMFHFDWLKIWLAPKIWLIEYSVNLVKTASGS